MLRRALLAAACGTVLAATIPTAVFAAPQPRAAGSDPERPLAGSASTSYVFDTTGTRTPGETWNRCAVITWALDLSLVKKHGMSVATETKRVNAALTQVAKYTGYRFSYVGTFKATIRRDDITGTNAALRIVYASGDKRDGRLYEPVLAHDGAAGWGGFRTWGQGGSPPRVVGGRVEINTQWAARKVRLHDSTKVTNTLLHELGHAMTLGHVTDQRQAMYPISRPMPTYGPGDIAGLRRLAQAPCAPAPSTPTVPVDPPNEPPESRHPDGTLDEPDTPVFVVDPVNPTPMHLAWTVQDGTDVDVIGYRVTSAGDTVTFDVTLPPTARSFDVPAEALPTTGMDYFYVWALLNDGTDWGIGHVLVVPDGM